MTGSPVARTGGSHVTVEPLFGPAPITYLGGIPDTDAADALFSSVSTELGADAQPALDAGDTPYCEWRLSATLRDEHPLAALTVLSRSLDRALLTVGLFDRFDTTGRRMSVGPA